MKAYTLSESDAAGTAAVFGLLGDGRFRSQADDVRTLTPFRDVHSGIIVEFLYRSGLDTLHPRRKMAFSLCEPVRDWSPSSALNGGLKVAMSWPRGFFDLVEQMDRTTNAHGPIMRWIESFPHGTGATMRTAVADYMLGKPKPFRN